MIIDVCLINFRTENVEETNSVSNILNKKKFLREPPNGLLILASILEEQKFNVEILDCSIINKPFDFIRKNAKNYRLIGFTTLTNTFYQTIELVKLVKRYNPNVFIIGGGPHISFTFQDVLNKYPFIDCACVGESEYSFCWLVKKLLIKPSSTFIYNNNKDLFNFTKNYPGKIQELLLNSQNSISANIDTKNKKNFKLMNTTKIDVPKGIAFLSKPKITPFLKDLEENNNINYKNNLNNDEIIFTGFPHPVHLETLPLPARHTISLKYDVANVIINRGCPYKCSFCARTHLFPKVRIRSLESVIAELNQILSYSNYKFVNFYDNINLDREFFEEFLKKLIELKFPLPWGAELRADSLTSNQVDLLKKANCKIIATGIESADETVLKTNFKFQDPQKVKKGIELLKQAQIAVQLYFVLGLPNETDESFKRTLDYIKTLPLEKGVDKLDFFIATPYPGSDLFELKQEFKLKIINHNLNLYNCKNIIFETPILNRFQIKEHIKKANSLKKELGLL